MFTRSGSQVVIIIPQFLHKFLRRRHWDTRALVRASPSVFHKGFVINPLKTNLLHFQNCVIGLYMSFSYSGRFLASPQDPQIVFRGWVMGTRELTFLHHFMQLLRSIQLLWQDLLPPSQLLHLEFLNFLVSASYVPRPALHQLLNVIRTVLSLIHPSDPHRIALGRSSN